MQEPSSPSLRLELRPVQVQSLEQTLQLVPLFALERYIGGMGFIPSPEEKVREKAIQIIKETVHRFKRDRTLIQPANIKTLKRLFINTYCAFNFLSPELEILNELQQERSSFLETMGREPFYLVDDGKPTALNLYFLPPIERTLESDLPANEQKTILQLQMFDLSKGQIDKIIDATRRIERNIILSAREAYADIRAKENRLSLIAQLNFLIADIINPKIFDIPIESYGISDAKEIYAQSAERNGDFKIPLPEIA